MAKQMAKIIHGEKPGENLIKLPRHIYLEDIEKAQITGAAGVSAKSMDYRDFCHLKSRGENFYVELEQFGE